MKNSGKLINFDFEGFNEHAMTVKDILKSFGAVYNEDTHKWEIDDTERLEITPAVLQDDGMGYGTDLMYLIEGNFSADNKSYNFFRDSELEYIYIWEEAGIVPGISIKVDDIEWMPMYADETDQGHIIMFYELNVEKMQNKTFAKRAFTVEEIKKYLDEQYNITEE